MKVLPKLLHTLELFRDGGTLAFAEIVRRTNLTPSNAAHIVKALCDQQLLEKTAFGHYRIGDRLFQLTGGNRERSLLNMLAARSADGIAGVLHELGVVVGFWRNRRVTLAKVQPERMVQLAIADRWFEKSGWYRLSSGRLLLALQPDPVIETILAEIGPPSVDEWPEAVSSAGFRAAIARIRAERQVVMQREKGHLTSLAVPVRDAGNVDNLCVSTVYLTGHQPLGNAGVVARLREIADDLHTQILFHNIHLNHIE